MTRLTPMLLTALVGLACAAPAPTPAPTPAPAPAPTLTPAPTPTPAPIARRAAALPAYPIAQGTGTATIFYDGPLGSPDAAMTLLVLQPGAAVPPHVHPTSTEMLYILEGTAEMLVGADLVTLQPGDAARIPMGAEHSARVVGDHPLRALQIYSPAGPEQRFVPTP